MKLADSAALLGFAALARSMAVLPLVREEDCVCKTDRFFDVQVVVHETPAGYHVPIETLVEQPTVLELVPGCTLTVSDVPTSICTTVIPTAVIRSTKYVSPARPTLRMGQAGADEPQDRLQDHVHGVPLGPDGDPVRRRSGP